MGKFENAVKIIVIVAGVLTVIDIMGIIHAIKRRIKAGVIKASADAYKTALDAEIALANFTWSVTIEKIRIICDSYTSDKRYVDMDKTVMFDNARSAVMKSIDQSDLDRLKKDINPDIEYMISLLVASALDKDRRMPPTFSPDMMPYDWFYNQFDDDDEDDEDDDDED